MESFSRYVAAGINVALGTDTFPPDIVQEMRVGALVNKVVDRQRGAGSVAEFYNAATIGGARAFGRDDLGKLAPGCAADITIFDLSDFATGPVDDPLRTLIHVATGKNCDTVMVAGKIVVENGSIPGLDEEALAHKAQHGGDLGLVAEHLGDAFVRDRPATVRADSRGLPGVAADHAAGAARGVGGRRRGRRPHARYDQRAA